YALSGDRAGNVLLWSLADFESESKRLEGHTGAVTGVGFSGGDRQALTVAQDGASRAWGIGLAESGQTLPNASKYSVLNLAPLPRSRRVIAGCSDHCLRVWDAGTGEIIRVLRGHDAAVNGVAVSADGTRVLSGSEDRTLRVWDVASGKEISR